MDSRTVEIGNKLYVAHFLDDTMEWGLGAIQPIAEHAGTLDNLAQTVIDNLTNVSPEEMKYSCCTDGRCPIHLLTGDPVPVREQLVGGDTMIAFSMAEALGNRFYSEPSAPVQERIEQVVSYLYENGFAGTHIKCGMADLYVPVLGNIVALGKIEEFRSRTKLFTPDGVFEDALYEKVIKDTEQRLHDNLYDGYSGELAVTTVASIAGEVAVAELLDDGKGVHGHTEELIARLGKGICGVAINERAVFESTGGREVFGVNDDRMQRLAELFGRGHDTDYRIASIAGEVATNGGHASLSRGLPTLKISLAA